MMRNQFAESLSEQIKHHSNIFLVYGDIGNKLFDNFKSISNSNYVNAGVAEPSMVTMAAGLAKSGYKPIVYTINSFLYLKTIEQIKIDICYPNLPVILVGTGGGLAYSELGTTHHSLEDIGMLTTIPNLQILAPSDVFEVSEALDWALRSAKPTYIRIGKKENSYVHEFSPKNSSIGFGPFKINPQINSNVALITYGSIAQIVKKSVEAIELELQIELWTFPCLKPILKSQIEIFSNYETLIIIEEHTPFGSLSSLINQVMNQYNLNVPRIVSLNTGDSFHTGLGKTETARAQLGLSESKIIEFLRVSND